MSKSKSKSKSKSMAMPRGRLGIIVSGPAARIAHAQRRSPDHE